MIRASELIGFEATRRYDDTGDPVYSTHERVLLALRWFGWVTAERLYEALDLDTTWHSDADARRERAKISFALQYWVKRGRVRKQGQRETRVEYQLIHPSRWGESVECVRCSSERVPGKTMCQRHLDYERDYKRARRAA